MPLLSSFPDSSESAFTFISPIAYTSFYKPSIHKYCLFEHDFSYRPPSEQPQSDHQQPQNERKEKLVEHTIAVLLVEDSDRGRLKEDQSIKQHFVFYAPSIMSEEQIQRNCAFLFPGTVIRILATMNPPPSIVKQLNLDVDQVKALGLIIDTAPGAYYRGNSGVLLYRAFPVPPDSKESILRALVQITDEACITKVADDMEQSAHGKEVVRGLLSKSYGATENIPRELYFSAESNIAAAVFNRSMANVSNVIAQATANALGQPMAIGPPLPPPAAGPSGLGITGQGRSQDAFAPLTQGPTPPVTPLIDISSPIPAPARPDSPASTINLHNDEKQSTHQDEIVTFKDIICRLEEEKANLEVAEKTSKAEIARLKSVIALLNSNIQELDAEKDKAQQDHRIVHSRQKAEVATLRQDVVKLGRVAGETEKEVRKLREQLLSAEKLQKEHQKHLEDTIARMKELEDNNADYEYTLKAKDTEIAELKGKVDSKNAEVLEKVSELERKVQEYEDAKAAAEQKLRDAVKAKEDADAKCDSICIQLSDANDQKRHLKAQLEDMQKLADNSLKKEDIDKLTADLKAAETKIASLQEELCDTLDKMQNVELTADSTKTMLEARIAALEEANTDLTAQLSKARSVNNATFFEAKIQELNRENARIAGGARDRQIAIEKRLEGVVEDKKRLEAEMSLLREKFARNAEKFKGAEDELERVRKELEDSLKLLTDSNNKLITNKATIKLYHVENEKMKRKLIPLRKKVEELEIEKARANGEVKALLASKKKLEFEKKTLMADKETLEVDNVALVNAGKILDGESSIESGELEELKKELEQTNAKLSDVTKKLEDAGDKLLTLSTSKLKADHDNFQLIQRLKEKDEVIRLMKANAATPSSVYDSTSIQQLEMLSAELASTKNKHADLTESFRAVETESRRLMQRLADCQSRLRDSERVREELEQKLKRSSNSAKLDSADPKRLDELLQEITQLKFAKTIADKERTNLETKVKGMADEIEKSGFRATAAENLRVKSDGKLVALEAKLRIIEAEKEAEIKKLENQLFDAKREGEQAKTRMLLLDDDDDKPSPNTVMGLSNRSVTGITDSDIDGDDFKDAAEMLEDSVTSAAEIHYNDAVGAMDVSFTGASDFDNTDVDISVAEALGRKFVKDTPPLTTNDDSDLIDFSDMETPRVGSFAAAEAQNKADEEQQIEKVEGEDSCFV